VTRPPASTWNDATMPNATTPDPALHAGELVMVRFPGKRLDQRHADFLRSRKIRAVCLFRDNLGSAAEVRALTAELRDLMGPKALIAVDQEGGPTTRVTCLPEAPPGMCLGAANDEALAACVGAAMSRGLRNLGFNWNFAPVLDVNNNPRNPVIAERSFSEDPRAVARLAGAWMRGAHHEGVACCVKHFPGHGDTHVDSHRALPVVDKSRAALDALELLPFHALRSLAPAVMSAHIVYPQLDPEHPATLSRAVLGDLLRREWGYDGVVITDSLVMEAIHERYGHDRAAVMALRAGADMVMALGGLHEQAAAVDAIEAAMASGELGAADLRRSQGRLDALARRYPVDPGDYPAARRIEDEALMREAWARGLSTIGAARAPTRDQPIRVITQRSAPSDGVAEAGPSGDTVAGLFGGFADAEVLQVDDLDQLAPSAWPRDGRFNVLVSNRNTRYGEAARHWPVGLHISLWNPFQVMDIAAPALLSWGYADGALLAVRAWLEGAPATGRSPVRLHPSAG
jgi:beta-N-acetylhexosaminidase